MDSTTQSTAAASRIQGVAMVILMEHDLEAAVAFYTALGLPLIFHLKEKWAEFMVHGVRIGLCPTSVKPEYDVHTGIVLAVDDLRALYADYKEKGIFLAEPKEAAHGIMLSMKDPGGNIVDLYQHTPEVLADLIKEVAEKKECCGGANAACKDSSCS